MTVDRMVFFFAIALLGLGPAQDVPELRPAREAAAVGTHYRALVHFDDQAAANRMLVLAEAAWTHAMEVLGMVDASAPDNPLVMNLYPSKAEYAVVEERLTRGVFRDTESFAHWDSLTAHVALAPPIAVGARAEAVLTSQTCEVLLHEAAHLALYAVLANYRSHPTWFAEGFAMTVEYELAHRMGLVESAAQHPRFSSNQLRARRLQEQGRVPSIAAILDGRLWELSFDERYALWFEFFRVLRAPDNRAAFQRLMESMRRLQGGRGMTGRVAAAVRREYDERELERDLALHLGGLKSEWDEVTRSLETVGSEWMQCAFPEHDALAWRTDPVGQLNYAIQGRLVMLGSTATEGDTEVVMRVLLGRSPGSYAAVEFRPGVVVITRHAGERREVIAEVPCATLGAREEYAFRIDVAAGALEVSLDGSVRAAATLPMQVPGAWGLGVGRAGAGLWRDVRVLR